MMFDRKVYPHWLKRAVLFFLIGSPLAYAEVLEEVFSPEAPPPVEAVASQDPGIALEGDLLATIRNYDGKLGDINLLFVGNQHHGSFQVAFSLPKVYSRLIFIDRLRSVNLPRHGVGIGYRYLFRGNSPRQETFLGGYLSAHAKEGYWLHERANIDGGIELATENLQGTVNGYGVYQAKDVPNRYTRETSWGLSARLSTYYWQKMSSWGRIHPFFFGARTQVIQKDKKPEGERTLNGGFGFRWELIYYTDIALEGKFVWDTLKTGKLPNFQLGLQVSLAQRSDPSGNYPIHRLRALPQRYRPDYDCKAAFSDDIAERSNDNGSGKSAAESAAGSEQKRKSASGPASNQKGTKGTKSLHGKRKNSAISRDIGYEGSVEATSSSSESSRSTSPKNGAKPSNPTDTGKLKQGSGQMSEDEKGDPSDTEKGKPKVPSVMLDQGLQKSFEAHQEAKKDADNEFKPQTADAQPSTEQGGAPSYAAALASNQEGEASPPISGATNPSPENAPLPLNEDAYSTSQDSSYSEEAASEDEGLKALKNPTDTGKLKQGSGQMSEDEKGDPSDTEKGKPKASSVMLDQELEERFQVHQEAKKDEENALKPQTTDAQSSTSTHPGAQAGAPSYAAALAKENQPPLPAGSHSRKGSNSSIPRYTGSPEVIVSPKHDSVKPRADLYVDVVNSEQRKEPNPQLHSPSSNRGRGQRSRRLGRGAQRGGKQIEAAGELAQPESADNSGNSHTARGTTGPRRGRLPRANRGRIPNTIAKDTPNKGNDAAKY